MNLRTQHIRLLYEITQQIATLLDLDELLSRILALTISSTGAEQGSIFLLDAEGKVERQILIRRDLPPAVSRQVVQAVLEKGLAGWVLRHRRGAVVADAQTDPRWLSLPDAPYTVRSALAVPFIHQERVYGLLTLIHSQPGVFTEEDLALLTAVGHQAAAAIQNARLYEYVRRQQSTLTTIINSVQDPILVLDPQGLVFLVNPAASRALGLESDAIVGHPLSDSIAIPQFLELVRQAQASGQPGQAEITWEDGRTFEVVVQPVEAMGTVITLHDITHFKALDTLKDELVATVSHDLKSPLGLIYGHAGLLKEAIEEIPSYLHESVEAILGAVMKMQTLIDSLLDLAQIEAGMDRMTECCLMDQIVEEVVDSFRFQAEEKQITLKLEIAPHLPPIVGNPLRLSQAVSNLVSNAIKYTPPGGRVTVCLFRQEDALVVTVTDTGPGIPPAKQRGLFSKFYRTGMRETIAQEGHGLGLAIVRSVVEAHGGKVWVESQVGQGSTFGFTLPISREKLEGDL
ncbi:MAG: GAF domain-containing protein [Chloroflexi bacterium]|nr:MAG: GAF domain-containing protein [Chloroflexota bacterium]